MDLDINVIVICEYFTRVALCNFPSSTPLKNRSQQGTTWHSSTSRAKNLRRKFSPFHCIVLWFLTTFFLCADSPWKTHYEIRVKTIVRILSWRKAGEMVMLCKTCPQIYKVKSAQDLQIESQKLCIADHHSQLHDSASR